MKHSKSVQGPSQSRAGSFFGSAKKQCISLGRSLHLDDWRVSIPVVIMILAIIFIALPLWVAQAPGKLGYGIKRVEESAAIAMAPTNDIRNSLRLGFAKQRVDEAAYVATHSQESGGNQAHAAANVQIAPDNAKAAATINQLVSEFVSTYQGYTTTLSNNIDQNRKPDSAATKQLQKQAVQIYAALALLRVEAPDAAQTSVLTGVDTIQKNIATAGDAIGAPPLSSSDVAQLTKLVSVGVLSKTDLDALLNLQMSNRQFHNKLVDLVNTKKLPSNLMYALDEDLVKQVAPDKVSGFETVSDFEQLQRISATVQASRPTKSQQQAVQAYLSKYKPGEAVPTGDIQPFVTPIVYGMALAGELQSNLSSLSSIPLSSDDQAILDSWKGSLAANQQNLGQLYQQLMTGAANQPDLHQRLLARVQQEFVDAQKTGVTQLVMPPGWDEDQLSGLSDQMGIEVAANRFVAANPNPDQQLAILANTQKQLNSSLGSVNQTNNTITNQLQAQINNFTGTPEQVTQLRDLLSSLTQAQTTTITDLKTQLAGESSLRTQLAATIETLHSQQLSALAELELRAASNAKDLNATTKAELTTTLNQINQTTQNLITGLQTRADGLDSSQTTLQEQLDAKIQVITDNHAGLVAYVTAQLATGRASTDQLQSTLNSLENNLAGQANQLANLSTSTDALSQLVNQVQTTSTTGINDAQSQLDSLKIDQQTVKDSIATLRTTQATQLGQLSDQLGQLNVAQTETQVALADVNQAQAQTQASIGTLNNNFATLQTVLETTQAAQTTLSSDVAEQGSRLDSLQTQTQSAITQLSAAQSQLTAQVASLATNAANVSQTLATIQTTSTATQTQLDTLLANPPWSIIPAGTYVTQAEFSALEASLNAQFAQKAAALDAQYQAFQQQVNTQVQQINTTVTQVGQTATTQNNQQQQTIDSLNAQVQTLKTQVQALTPAAPGL